MTSKIVLTPSILRKALRYNPDTGDLWWRTRSADMFTCGKRSKTAKMRNFNGRFAGRIALNPLNSKGYKHGTVLGVKVLAHRVAYALFHNAWPFNDIDHINGIRTDNRISNLRDVSRSENLKNSKVNTRNTTGIIGVYRDNIGCRWYSQISDCGKNKHLGYFDSIFEAACARKSAEIKYGYHPNHGRI